MKWAARKNRPKQSRGSKTPESVASVPLESKGPMHWPSRVHRSFFLSDSKSKRQFDYPSQGPVLAYGPQGPAPPSTD